MKDYLILVDENDNETGYCDKAETHSKELLHRAFSLFIYNKFDNTLLLQRRAINKYHSGGLWTNSCCSHPRRGEKLSDAVIRRAYEELGITFLEDELASVVDSKGELKELGKFKYYCKYENCAEYEIDHVFLIQINRSDIDVVPDSSELMDYKWISLEKTEKMLKEFPDKFTAWFENAFNIIKEELNIQ